MRFHAYDRIRGGIEILERAAENLARDIEFGELGFLMREIFRREEFEQAPMARVSAQQIDGPIQLHSFSVV
jgi:hypothetical protein